MDEYVKGYRTLGFAAPTEVEINNVQKAFDDALVKHGKEFSGPYGWAHKHLQMKKPTFADLQDAVGRAEMKSFYKMASYPIHAGIKGITWRLSLFGQNPQTLLSGATNAGLEEPGQNMAISLVAITACLARPGNFDDALYLSTLGLQRDKAILALMRCAKRLRADHKKAIRSA